MEISSIINLMLILLILLLVGVFARKTGVINDQANKHLTRIVVVLAQSAMILAAVMNAEPSLTGLELLGLVGISFVAYAIMLVVVVLFTWVLRIKPGDRGVFQFMALFGNVGFMGFPIVASLFGDAAVFYASLFNIPFNLLTYSLGIMMISPRSGEKVKINIKQFINAPLVSSFVAVLIFALKIPIPAPVAGATELLGDMVVPAAMLIIGSSLGDMSLKEVFSDWRLYLLAPVKLIAIPVIIWSVLRLFVANPLILGIATVLASMPVATNTTMLCIEYKGNEALASKGVFITTILSVATIPLTVYLLLI
jgi:predicted permease